MKSNLRDKVINVDRNKIILSVGMIVKNEEKHLENCLSALKKLLDNVPSELIIVDTGSTDRTKEIALKYTDKVYDFEWNNDFSAARNYGLERAKGEWFMSIDADEYLDENCDEMIKFFNMPEVREKYNSASFIIVNYGGKVKKAVNEFLAPRIVRLAPDVRFHDPIHEWLPQPNPHGSFTTCFHHYGYAYQSEKEKIAKTKRNYGPIMEEYKQNPNDLRVLSHLCDAICIDNKNFKTFDDIEKVYLEYLDGARKNPSAVYSHGAYIKIMTLYISNKRYKEALKISDEFLQFDDLEDNVIMVAIYYLRAAAYMCLEDYEHALPELRKYLEYYDRYKKRELYLVELRFTILSGLSDACYEENLLHIARCLNYEEKYDEALVYLDKVSLEDMSFANLRIFLNVIRDLVRESRNYKYAASCYEKILAFEDADKTGLILFLMEQYYMENPVERAKFVEDMINSGVNGPYIELMKLVRDDSNGKDISKKLTDFISKIDRWDDGYAEAIYLAMKHDVDLSCVIDKLSSKLLKETLQMISQAHLDYAEIALKYCAPENFSDSIKKLLWVTTALEQAVYVSNELSDDDKPILFDTFLSVLSDYISNIYNPDLLNLEDVDVLPELHRFGYYMIVAITALNNGDEIAYIRGLKEALRLCEPMKDLVSFYLTEFENSLKCENQ